MLALVAKHTTLTSIFSQQEEGNSKLIKMHFFVFVQVSEKCVGARYN